MVFNSYSFAVFLLVVLVLHALPVSWRVKKLQLLIASYLFYAAWNPPFVLLLVLSTVVDWFAALGISRATDRRVRRGLLVVSLVANLGLLGFFKYANFLLDNWIWLAAQMGFSWRPLPLDIILPVGISFYTFQTLSYTLDVYRGEKPCRSFLDFALYVTFFPQLVAGPIVRASDFLPQCEEPRRATHDQLGWGFCLLLFGLFLKMVVADGLLAPTADVVFHADRAADMVSAWIGTLAFAGQIYCDFAGYSLCAIGVALCLGFSLPDNFRSPYAAIGFSDFWRRWHISLSTWLRDYLYVPLGGNRAGFARTLVNLMFTMLIGGLWHGASWMFVIWGGLHGLFLVVERLLARIVPATYAPGRLTRLLLGLGTFALVCLTWVYFRAESLTSAWQISLAMLGIGIQSPTRLVSPDAVWETCFVMALLLTAHWSLRERTLEQVASRSPWWVRSVVMAGLLLAVLLLPGEDRAFVYFQF